MKNLLHDDVKQEIYSRIDRLNADTKPLWGKMNVCQALRHMTLSNEMPIGAFKPSAPEKGGPPKWLIKLIMINANIPKSIDTFKEMNVVERGIETGPIEEEKAKLKAVIAQLTSEKTFVPEHQAVGKFSKDNWGKLSYNHTNHHLKQFGV